MKTRTDHRRAAAILLAALFLTLLPASTAADTVVSRTGNTGTYALVDTPEYPGVTCRYTDFALTSIRVRWPHVEGYNWTSGSHDNQKVLWKFKLKRSDTNSGGPYTVVYTSPPSSTFTLDNVAAKWPAKTYTFSPVAPPGWYTVDVLMYWYHPNDTSMITGSARSRVDWSRQIYTSNTFTSESPCPWAD